MVVVADVDGVIVVEAAVLAAVVALETDVVLLSDIGGRVWLPPPGPQPTTAITAISDSHLDGTFHL